MQSNKTKRGFAQIVPMILMLGAAIILLTVFVRVNDEITTTMRGDVLGVVNESAGALNNATWTALDNPDITAITAVWIDNTTGSGFNESITAGNYSVRYAEGQIKLSNAGELRWDVNGSRITYNYYEHGSAYNVSSAGTNALENISDYWGLLVTIGIFVIILGLIAGAFVTRGRR